jgi:predicted RNA binding protein YcfA (HicA-like mRNA interferase family)
MARVPRISAREAIRAFERAGFSVIRISGSHHIMKKEGHRALLTIPVHGKNMGVGLLRSQIIAAGLTVEQFIKLL